MVPIKIFRVCPAPFHTSTFRADHRLDQRSFAEQIRLLKEENLLMPGGWASVMEEEGFEVFETLYNDFALQSQWCKENRPSALSMSNMANDINFQILKEQIRFFEPDVIFIYAGGFFFLIPEYIRELRSLLNKKVILSGFWGDELPKKYSYKEYFHDLDFAFCGSSIYETKFSEAGIPALNIGNCFDHTIKFPIPTKKIYDFVFSGTTGYGFVDHIGRYEKILAVMSRSNLQVWANEPQKIDYAKKEKILHLLFRIPSPVLKFFMILLQTAVSIRIRLKGGLTRAISNFKIFGKVKQAVSIVLSEKSRGANAESFLKGSHPMANYFDEKKPLRNLFPQRVRPLLINCSDYYALMAGSKLVLNLHRDEDADIGNIRCFEVTGLGSCLVTDRGHELKEYFDIDNDIVTFETVEECLKKVEFLLAHPSEIERISKNGQKTTLSRHTVKHRAQVVSEKLKELLSNPGLHPIGH